MASTILRQFLRTALYHPGVLNPNCYLLNRIRNLDRLDPQFDRIVQLDPSAVKEILTISKVGSSETASITAISASVNFVVAIATSAGTAKYMCDNTNRLKEKKTQLAAEEYRKSLQAELELVKAQVDDLEAENRRLQGTHFISMCTGVALVTILLISLKRPG